MFIVFKGLTDGLFNVEFIWTSNGPKLLEINPRMSGYVLRDWLQKLYGIDIMVYSIMVACGIKPTIPELPTNKILMGVMVMPSLHAKLLTEDHCKQKLFQMIENDAVFFLQFRKLKETLSHYEVPFGNVAVTGTTSDEAKQKLLYVCRELGIDQEDYRVEDFIQTF
jgi:biotin carboxylase